MATAPDDLASILRDLARGLKLLDIKHDHYVEAKQYYDGDRAEIAASVAVRKLIQANAEAHPISLAHIPVDRLMDLIELVSLTAAEKPADDLLTQVYDDNDLEDEVDDWHRKAGYFGDYYVIVNIIDEDTSGNALTIKPVGSSPLTTIVMYDPADERTPLYGVKRWQDGKTWRANVFYDDVTVLLTTADKSPSWVPRAEDFALVQDADGSTDGAIVLHSGGKMLLVHYAVDGKPYGTPLHKKAFGPQDALTKISATNLSNVDGQGFASRWALQDPTAEIDDDIDDDFGDAGPSTAPGSLSDDGLTTATAGTSARVRTIPGAIALLKGIKAVGTFDATETDTFLKNQDWYVRFMAISTGVPMFEFDPTTGEAISGEARRQARASLVTHAKKVQRALGQAHKNLGDIILGVAGTTGTVAATFRPTETSTDAEGFTLIAQKIATGVPIQQAFLEAGYTDEQVDEWFPKDAPNLNYTTIIALAGALAQLGTAKTAGVITDTEIAAALPKLLTEARDEAPAAPVVAPTPLFAAPAVVNPADLARQANPNVPPAPPKGVTPPQLVPSAAAAQRAAAR